MKARIDSDTDGEFLSITLTFDDILAVDIDDVEAAARAEKRALLDQSAGGEDYSDGDPDGDIYPDEPGAGG